MKIKTNAKYANCVMAVVFAALVSIADAAIYARFYVSPVGSDSSPGTLGQPFLTLERARQAVRDIKSSMTGDIIVYLRGGRYQLNQPFVLEPVDSGINGHNIIYSRYGVEEPVLSGGEKVVTSWISAAGNIKKTNIGAGLDFRQIYVGGWKAVRARKPNIGEDLYSFSTEKELDGFNVSAGLLGEVSNLDKVEFAIKIMWMHKRLRVSGVYESGGYTRAIINPVEWDDVNNEPQGTTSYKNRKFWVENAYEFIDSPGEWYYDSSSGDLFYYPRPGENMAEIEVVIPKASRLIFLDGTLEDQVRNISIEGLTFSETNWPRPNSFGFVDVQANTLIPTDARDIFDAQYRHNQQKDRIDAAVQAHSSSEIVIRNCALKNLGGTGITFNYGGTDNVIENNLIADVCGSGIEVGNDCHQPSDSRMWPRRYVVKQNRILRIGTEYFGSVGFTGFYIDTLELENNEITEVPYSGISVGWGWSPSSGETQNVSIRKNVIERYMMELEDGGAIYTVGGAPNSSCSRNYILNPGLGSYGAIYHDSYSGFYQVNLNVIEAEKLWLFVYTSVIHDVSAEGNFSSTGNYVNNGTNVTVTNTGTLGWNWPQDAIDVINGAGLDSIPSFGSGYRESGAWTESSLLGYNGTRTRYATSAGAFCRWFAHLGESTYKASIYKVVYSNSDNNAKIDISHVGGTASKYVDYTSGSSGWVELGFFSFDGRDCGSVRNTKNSAGVARSDAVKFDKADLQEVIIVDDGQAGYSESGAWLNSALLGYNGTATRFGFGSGSYAKWNPSLVGGVYRVSIYKLTYPTSDNNAKIEICHAYGTQSKYLDFSHGRSGWVDLGVYTFNDGSSGYVRNLRNGGDYVRADAVKFERLQ